jgi:hypothetical protein
MVGIAVVAAICKPLARYQVQRRAGPYRRRRIAIAGGTRPCTALSDGRFPHRRGGADLVVAGAWPIFMSGK